MRTSILLLFPLLAGCVSTAADLNYIPTRVPTVQAAPLVAAVAVADARDETDPTYIGAIRGGYGNPLKTLTTKRPVKEEVAAAFIAALQARGLYGAAGPADLAVTLTELSANQYVQRTAHTSFKLVLTERASGRTLLQSNEDVQKISKFNLFDNGVFASTEDLRSLTALSLSQAVDQALDRAAFTPQH